MYVMESADESNKDHSHVAHKMKHKLMNFEDNNGSLYRYINCSALKLTFNIVSRGGFRGVSGVSRNPLHLKIFY